jgi:hypothetical protein
VTAAREGRVLRLYLDTSAYLCILLGEAGAVALSKETEGAELLSSGLLVLESKRNLVRLAREGSLKPRDFQTALDRVDRDLDQFALRDLTLELCQGMAMPAITTPRSLDLVHLRTALWFHGIEPIDRFVTLDETQQQAAREFGLPV